MYTTNSKGDISDRSAVRSLEDARRRAWTSLHGDESRVDLSEIEWVSTDSHLGIQRARLGSLEVDTRALMLTSVEMSGGMASCKKWSRRSGVRKSRICGKALLRDVLVC